MGERTNKSVLDMIDNLLEQADHVKQASNLDLASDSKSSHPSANVDDKTRPATEGARSAENKSDVQKQVPDNVEEAASKNTPGESENEADTMGTQSMAADETKGNVETPKKSDPKPAGEGPGNQLTMAYGQVVSAADLVGEANSLLEQLSTSLGVKSAQQQVAVATKQVKTDAEGKDEKEAGDVAGMYKAAAGAYPEDEEAGYVAASMLIDFLSEEKSSADQYSQTVDNIQKQASTDAESYISFLKGYGESVKAAQGLPPELAALAGGGGGPEAAMGGAAPEEAMMGGEGGGGEEAALAALAGAGGGEAGMGGEGGEEGGEGGPDDEAIIEAIAEALDEAGVTPEELAEAVAEAQGGAPMGGEGAPEGALEGALDPAAAGGMAPPEPKLASGQKGQVKKSASKDALRSAVQRIVRGK